MRGTAQDSGIRLLGEGVSLSSSKMFARTGADGGAHTARDSGNAILGKTRDPGICLLGEARTSAIDPLGEGASLSSSKIFARTGADGGAHTARDSGNAILGKARDPGICLLGEARSSVIDHLGEGASSSPLKISASTGATCAPAATGAANACGFRRMGNGDRAPAP